jgi:hypothetical protein
VPAVPTVSQLLLDLSIRHKLGLAGYEAWVVRKIIGLLNAADADLERRVGLAVERSAPLDTTDRLKAIRKELTAANREAYTRLGRFLTREMRELVTEEAGHLAGLVEQVLPFKFSATRPSSTLLRALVTEDPLHGRLLGAISKDGVNSHIENIAGRRAAALMEQIQLGVVQGESWGSIITRIRGTAAGGYRDGVLENVGRREAEVLARTAVQHFSEAARELAIQENADLFQGIMWVITLDLRACRRCIERQDKVWDLDHRPVGHTLEWLGGPGRLHFQDRCTGIPVFKEWDDLRALGIAPGNLSPDERAAMDGPVPQTTDFEGWLRRQTFEEQALALESKARARAFRDGQPLAEVWDMRFDRRAPQAPVR